MMFIYRNRSGARASLSRVGSVFFGGVCRYEEGLADLQQRGWDSDVAMSAMREAGGNSTAALLALEEEDRWVGLSTTHMCWW